MDDTQQDIPASDPSGQAGGQLDRVQDTLVRLTRLVEDARSMPLSASCVLNRSEVLGMLDELRLGLPSAVEQARELLTDQVTVVAAGRRQAGELLEQAEVERARLVSETAVLSQAQQQAERLLGDSREQATTMRREVEDYVDGKLATFEVVLSKTLDAVHRGRAQLEGTNELSALDPGLAAESLGETRSPLGQDTGEGDGASAGASSR